MMNLMFKRFLMKRESQVCIATEFRMIGMCVKEVEMNNLTAMHILCQDSVGIKLNKTHNFYKVVFRVREQLIVLH